MHLAWVNHFVFISLTTFNNIVHKLIRMNDLEQAAASAFTHYLKNMDDNVAIANVKHFRAMPGVRESYFRGEIRSWFTFMEFYE